MADDIIGVNDTIDSEGINKALKSVSTEINKVISDLIKLGKTFTELKSIVDSEKVSQENLRKTIENVDNTSKKLEKTNEQLNTTYSKVSKTLTEQEKALRANEAAKKKLEAANNIEYRNLVRNTAELNKQSKELLKNTENTNTWSKALDSFQAKFNTIGNIAGGLVTSGIQSVVNAVTQLIGKFYELEKRNQSVDLGFKTITSNASQMSAMYADLKILADQYGFSLIGLKEQYLNFTAASKGTNLEGEKSFKIFTAITGSMAKLGSSTEAQHRAFLALSQMMSKGCFLKGTEILLFNKDIKNVEDIKTGDIIMGDDFTERFVLKTTHGKSLMYEIKQSNGFSYYVNQFHILSLINKNNKKIDIPIGEFKFLNEDFFGYDANGNKFKLEIILTGFDEYYGFEISGNRRFLLSNYTVVHNTIQSEELRGQLSEALPGAFNDMAKAMGISVAELGKMLKSGQVLSAEALPKLAEELERKYDLVNKNAEAVDTLVAAEGRLENAETLLGKSTGSENWAKGWVVFKTFWVDFTANFIKDIKLISAGIATIGTTLFDLTKWMGGGGFNMSATRNLMQWMGEVQSGRSLLSEQEKKDTDEYIKLVDKKRDATTALNSKELSELLKKKGIYKKELDDYTAATGIKMDYSRNLHQSERNRLRELQAIQKDVTLTSMVNDKEAAKQKIKDEKEAAAEKERLRKEFEKNQEDELTNYEKNVKETYKGVMDIYQQVYDNRKQQINEQYLNEVDKINAAYVARREAGANSFNSEQQYINELSNAKQLQLQLQSDNEKAKYEQGVTNEDEYQKAINDIHKQSIDDQVKRDDALYENKIAKQQLYLDFTRQGIDAIAGFSDMLFAREESNITKKYKKQIDAAKKAGKDTTEIEAKQAKEIAAVKRKAAIADKVAKSVQAGMDIAVAIISNMKYGLWTVPIISAIGALNLATILGTPIPEYWKGGENLPEGFKIVGDRFGSELIKTPDGKSYLTPDTDTLVYTPKGTDIIPNKDIQKHIGSGIDISELVKEQRNTTNAIMSKQNQNITQFGIELVAENQRQRIAYTDTYLRK